MELKINAFTGTLALALPLLFSTYARAQGSDENRGDDGPPQAAQSSIFTLGQVTVTGKREDEQAIGTSTLDSEDMQDFNKESLKEALDIVPGVSVTTGSGSRNEADISIRGFNRYQVPLYMDGIRLYLPADNRIDVDRFLTMDLSEIQVSKGYVSVLNGPDGMGGAINLVTRKPVKPFESEVRLTGKLGEGGQYEGYTAYARLGGRQSQYYWQASIEQRDLDNWRLSRDFRPTAAENGGERDNTSKKDSRFNFKFGLTPNATDEYSLNFVQQGGEKHGIGAVTGTSAISTWDWPRWDVQSLYWLSHTQLGENGYLKTKAYYNTFKNDLVAYTNVALDTRNWTSHYDDNAKGISLELGTTALPQQTLKGALHLRRDEHVEWQNMDLQGSVEPKQGAIEDSYSLALEDTWHVTPQFDLVGGVSRDFRRMSKAQEYTAADGLFNYELANHFATNWQGAAIYRYREGGKLHFSVSRRARFPSMFERYSSRFGGALSNPYLKPERALNFELGIAEQISPGLQVEAAVFHSKVDDAIQSVNIEYMGSTYSQSQNVGKATFRGLELSVYARAARTLELGGNYTYILTRLDNPGDPSARLTTAPRNKAFLFARWKPMPALKIIPSVEYASARWSQPPSGSGYIRTGAYALLNLKAEYQLSPNATLSLSARNLFDRNYELASGYPEEGRSFMVAATFQF
ncbi:TonB-dependent receptor [Diaphorobacter ruginosibacter]|uniref:TonB-dependent receptor plug domain-containing protein n=1 Tax=Diaphorobacter ruginosibacter TaxID=1715720 RepID=UPI00334223B4